MMKGNKLGGMLGNTLVTLIILAVLGALVYGLFLYTYDIFGGIERGERGVTAVRALDDLRSSFIDMKQEDTGLQNSAPAVESNISSGRQKLTRFINLTDYNSELRDMAPKLMVSYEAWTALELDLASSSNSALLKRNMSAFVNVMSLLGESQEVLEEDIRTGASASRGLFVSTTIFIAYLIALAFIWLWSYSTRERRLYSGVRELQNLSSTDSLTGLTNRAVLEDRCATAIAGARRYKKFTGVLYFDLDGLNDLNVDKGYQAGDIVLKETALRLQQYTREMDTVARVGEDEFAVLITNLKRKDDAGVVIKKLQKALSQPVELSGEQYTPSVSIGAAVYPGDGDMPEKLVNEAINAMYKAKQTSSVSVASFQH